jgi:hypothetical protein
MKAILVVQFGATVPEPVLAYLKLLESRAGIGTIRLDGTDGETLAQQRARLIRIMQRVPGGVDSEESLLNALKEARRQKVGVLMLGRKEEIKKALAVLQGAGLEAEGVQIYGTKAIGDSETVTSGHEDDEPTVGNFCVYPSKKVDVWQVEGAESPTGKYDPETLFALAISVENNLKKARPSDREVLKRMDLVVSVAASMFGDQFQCRAEMQDTFVWYAIRFVFAGACCDEHAGMAIRALCYVNVQLGGSIPPEVAEQVDEFSCVWGYIALTCRLGVRYYNKLREKGSVPVGLLILNELLSRTSLPDASAQATMAQLREWVELPTISHTFGVKRA